MRLFYMYILRDFLAVVWYLKEPGISVLFVAKICGLR